MKKIVITGGAGFIGSHIVERFVALYPAAEIVVLDKMTYAADIQNIFPLMESRKINLLVGDISNFSTCQQAVQKADLVIHAAAESHVDNSFGNSFEFTQTNVKGTHCLMEACREAKVSKIIHVSTDEVYGEVLEGAASEESILKPTNPYSASKAAAEMIVNGYRRSFNLPVVILRANNIYGIRQYPEKIIPKFITSILMGRKLTIHGNGKNTRHYLSAIDMADALKVLVDKGEAGQAYNIGTEEEYQNLEIATMICKAFGLKAEDKITYIEDRPFNDFRYAVDWKRIQALGWTPRNSLRVDLPKIVQWYVDNLARYEDPSKAVITTQKAAA